MLSLACQVQGHSQLWGILPRPQHTQKLQQDMLELPQDIHQLQLETQAVQATSQDHRPITRSTKNPSLRWQSA